MLFIVYLLLLLFAWAVVSPVQAVELVENIRQRLDQYTIELAAGKDLQTLKAQFRAWGIRRGFQLEAIDGVFDEHSNVMLQMITAKYSRVDVEELVLRCD